MGNVKHTDHTKPCGGWNLHTLLVGMKNDTTTLELVWKFLTLFILHLLYDPVIEPLSIYPIESKHGSLSRFVHKCSYLFC